MDKYVLYTRLPVIYVLEPNHSVYTCVGKKNDITLVLENNFWTIVCVPKGSLLIKFEKCALSENLIIIFIKSTHFTVNNYHMVTEYNDRQAF